MPQAFAASRGVFGVRLNDLLALRRRCSMAIGQISLRFSSRPPSLPFPFLQSTNKNLAPWFSPRASLPMNFRVRTLPTIFWARPDQYAKLLECHCISINHRTFCSSPATLAFHNPPSPTIIESFSRSKTTGANAKVSGVQHGALARAKMAKPCPSKCGVLDVRASLRAA